MKPVIHRAVCSGPSAGWFRDKFASNGWTGSWSGGVYDWHHFHLKTHEVLGCHSGQAVLRLGGENGQDVPLAAGDVVVIPAGLAHRCLSAASDFAVLGAYPDGAVPDIQAGEGVPCPLPKWRRDPVTGEVS